MKSDISENSLQLSNKILKLIASNQIDWAATGRPDLEVMLSGVMGIVAESLQCDAGSLFLYDQFQNTLMLRATSGLNPGAVGQVVISAESGITGLAATSRITQATVTASEHPSFLPNALVGEEGLTSQLSVPIILEQQSQLIGVLNLQTFEPRAFFPDEIEFVESISNVLAVAIQSARLYIRTDAALQQRVNELSLLQVATRELTANLQPGDLMQKIVESARRLLDGSAAYLYRTEILPNGCQHLALMATSPKTASDTRVIAEFASLMIERVFARASPGSRKNRSTLFGAPLVIHGSVWGVLCVQVSARASGNDELLNLLQAFSASAGLALENAELYAETRRRFNISQVLLQEMHHRVRNNLQIVAALLSMQANQETSLEVIRPLHNAVARVQSIASIHDLLSTDDITTTTVQAVARRVADEASITTIPPNQTVQIDVEPGEIQIRSRQATVLALMFNECFTNSILHGLDGRDAGTISVAVTQDEDTTTVVISDDGIGLPEPFDANVHSGLGTKIARTLAISDLGGTFELVPGKGGGTQVVIQFPAESESTIGSTSDC